MKSYAGKTAVIAIISAGVTAILIGLLPPIRPYLFQVFLLTFCSIIIGWRPIMLPGDLSLRVAMVEKPALAVLSLMGLTGLIIISIVQILMIHSML
jgi:hypothetical protein